MCSGGLSSAAEICAPISRSGAIIRPIGRPRNDASPVKTEANFCPHNKPASSRIAVPELPISNAESGARKPCKPTPSTEYSPAASREIDTPSRRNAPIVASTSSPSNKLVSRLRPRAIAANITARWEMDLSAATRMSPRNGVPGVTVSCIGGSGLVALMSVVSAARNCHVNVGHTAGNREGIIYRYPLPSAVIPSLLPSFLTFCRHSRTIYFVHAQRGYEIIAFGNLTPIGTVLNRRRFPNRLPVTTLRMDVQCRSRMTAKGGLVNYIIYSLINCIIYLG